MDKPIIAEHALKHGVSPEDILHAWENFVRKRWRGAPDEGEVILVGTDRRGRLVEVVAAERPFGTVIFHAMRPPTRNALTELEMEGRKR